MIRKLVREVLVEHPFDVMYFDGPYQGMQNAKSCCHCLPVVDVKVRVRVPQGRTVRSVSLLRPGEQLPVRPQDGWLDLTIPRVLIHEALRVDLA